MAWGAVLGGLDYNNWFSRTLTEPAVLLGRFWLEDRSRA